jgi:hypothetical protein
MRACTNWDTDLRRRAAGLSLLALLATGLPARPAGADDGDLDRLLEKAVQAVDKAADAARGRDPGRVSHLLIKADEQIGTFATASGLGPLAAALDAAGAAAARGEFPAATTEIRAARSRIARVNGYIVPRRAEETGRAALTAADAGDAAGLATAIEGLRAALRADVLLARLHDARGAIARAREAMVRGDLAAGRTAIAAAQAGLAGFQYAVGLSRATYNLAAGADLLQAEALIGARDLVRRAARDLRLAVDTAPAAQRQPVEEAYRTADDLWKRMNRPREVEPAALRDTAARVEAIRQEQGA